MIVRPIEEKGANGQELALEDEAILADPAAFLSELKSRWLIDFLENKGF